MNVTEKIEQVATSPIISKVAPAIPIGSGSAYILDLTQGVFALISIAIGIIAGVYVIVINHKRNKLIDKELEIKDLEIDKLKGNTSEVEDGD